MLRLMKLIFNLFQINCNSKVLLSNNTKVQIYLYTNTHVYIQTWTHMLVRTNIYALTHMRPHQYMYIHVHKYPNLHQVFRVYSKDNNFTMINECGLKLFHDSMGSVVLQAVCVTLSKYKRSCQTKGAKGYGLTCGPRIWQVGSSLKPLVEMLENILY